MKQSFYYLAAVITILSAMNAQAQTTTDARNAINKCMQDTSQPNGGALTQECIKKEVAKQQKLLELSLEKVSRCASKTPRQAFISPDALIEEQNRWKTNLHITCKPADFSREGDSKETQKFHKKSQAFFTGLCEGKEIEDRIHYLNRLAPQCP